MLDDKTLAVLLPNIVSLVRRASAAVMEIYEARGAVISYKADTSPVTNADMAANQIIIDGLARLTPTIPVVSEESLGASGTLDFTKLTYWLVDPIDGTKEFLAHNGEFTVNIGLINQGQPVLGVVDAPAKGQLFYGCRNTSAYKVSGISVPEVITAGSARPVRRVAISRSHPNELTTQWLDRHGLSVDLRIGSSLKLCLVADGSVDISPRLGPQHEWDIAAADAVLRSAGGQLTDSETAAAMQYGHPERLTPHYIASACSDAAYL